jgi:hypothetical protein
MIVKRTIQEDDDGKLIECIINSSNILKTDYFAHRNRLYVYFNRGKVYSYGNITEEVYKNFEEADSQGEFLRGEIMKKSNKYPYNKEFSLTESEINETKYIIEEWKEDNNLV